MFQKKYEVSILRTRNAPHPIRYTHTKIRHLRRLLSYEELQGYNDFNLMKWSTSFNSIVEKAYIPHFVYSHKDLLLYSGDYIFGTNVILLLSQYY